DGASEMNVKLGELVAERVRHRAKASGGLASLLACRRSSDAPAAARPGGLALGMVAPHDVTVVVRGGHADEPIPELRPTDVLLRLIARDLTLEHDIAVVRRPDDFPAVLGEEVEQPRDLGQTLRRLGHVLAEPAGGRALAAVRPIDLIAEDRKSTRLNSSH